MFVALISFLFLLAVLVLAHEFGHFKVARYFKITVEEFGFGFPPRAWSKLKNGVVYSLNWVPLGGFVKIKGENGDGQNEPDSFASQKFHKKVLVLAAGVLMNVVLAWFLFTVGYMFGLPGMIDEQPTGNVKVSQTKSQIVQVLPNSPASLAGLKMGDIINSVDNQVFNNSADYVKYLRAHSDREIIIKVERKSGIQEIKAKADKIDGQDQKILGVNIASTGFISYPWYQAPWEAAKLTGNVLVQIVIGLYSIIIRLFQGLGAGAAVSGPVGVAVMTGQMVDLGWRYFLQFGALLSLNLAVVNILPIPALDGGRILFLIIEKIRRKPNRASLENAFHQAGFILLMVLVVLVTWKDVAPFLKKFF